MPDLEPLDPDVRAILDRIKPIEELDAARKAGLFDRFAARLALPGIARAPEPPPPAATAAVSAAGRTVMIAAASLGIGVGAGIVLDRTVLAPPVANAPSSAVTAPAPTPPVAPAFTATAFVSSLPAAPRTASAPASVAPKESAPRPPDASRGLAAERALLDVARAALSRGDAADATEAVARHEREFPDGILVEEREAIAVRALVAMGRRDEARARANEFRRRFPNSVNLHAVNAAVGAEP